MKSKEFYDQNNVEIISSTKVIAIDRNKKSLTLSNTENLQYENLVLATGSI